MEGDLLEISEEDNDSLLLQHQKIQTDVVSSFDPSFFSCSPLHFPISNPTDVKARCPTFSSNINKENISNTETKSELPKLSLEPHQMKRKKKVGGYNLRRSLAWDRAFFTEEGVLNSTELSLISGNFSKLSGEKLLTIEEEPGESLSGGSSDLQALESNLFKELPLNNSNAKEAKKIGISSLRQKSSGSASRFMVKQNVLSDHDVNRSGSKRSGCPRPVMSSALKRPANVSTTKTAVKEPKVSKIPAPKSESSTARSSPNLKKPKRNQSAPAAVSAHRSIGSAVSNKSTKTTQNDAKSRLSSRSQITKSSIIQPKRNMKSSGLSSHSSALSQNPLENKVDNVLNVNKDPVLASGHGSIDKEAGSNKIASLPRSVCHIGGDTQYAQQTVKPSGLRMPSPSLGFFTQSKINTSHNIQSSSQQRNNPKSNIPNLQKLGVLNSTFEISTPSMKVHVMANDVAAIANSRMSSIEPSVPSSASSLCEDIRPDSRTSKIPRKGVRVPCNSYNHELTNNQQQLHATDSDLKQQNEKVEFQCNDDKLLLQSESSEEVKLDCKGEDLVIPRSLYHIGSEFKDPHFFSYHGLLVKSALKADNAGNQLSGNERNNSLTENFDLLRQLHSCDVNSSNIHGSPILNSDRISIHNRHEHSSKQAEHAKPCTFKDDQASNEIVRPHINNDGALVKEGEPLEEFLCSDRVQNKGICPNVRDCNASELERNDGLSHYGGRIQGNGGTVGANDLNEQSHVADAQKDSFEFDLSLEGSSGLLNASGADNQHTHVNDVTKKTVQQLPIPDPCIVVETFFQDNYESHSTDCLLHGEIFSSEEFLAESNLRHAKGVARQRGLANSSSPCGIPPALQNCVHEMAECLHVEKEPSISTDSQCNHDIELLCEATSSKGLERNKEDQVTGAITSCDIGVSNDYQGSGDLGIREMDDSHSISPLGLIDDIIDLKNVEGNPYYLSANCNSAILEPGEKIACHFDAPTMLTNSLPDKQNDCETIAQDEVIQYSCEDGNNFQENQILEACNCLFSGEGQLLEESRHFDDSDSCADIGPGDKIVIRAVEGPDLSQVQTYEPNDDCADGGNEMANWSFWKDVCLQSSDGGLSFNSCKTNLFTSAETSNSAVIENLNKPPELQSDVTVMPEQGKFGLSTTEEISSHIKITLSDDNCDACNDMTRPDNDQSGQVTTLNVELSSLSEDQISGAGNSCKLQAFCLLDDKPTSSINTSHTSSNGSLLQEEVNRLESDVPEESNSSVIPVEAKGTTLVDTKQVAPVVKPPLNAVPFSDEWLAAFEAAGEEVLTMKSGAVQNSPKDKSLPEPGPWSPVRKKNNQKMGPFDCTKFTNTNIPPGFE
ncbi:hypothetical protein J1N35_001893 [Gossypium stocksii]|uniref:Uncharacterized protein n=1 Tax=Gossypium stocksii TaxID=47602 RepID=A0A9D4AK13_9ROSI|nr:hypothetical protein J1N35_001893 [Gossypium stocksii]